MTVPTLSPAGRELSRRLDRLRVTRLAPPPKLTVSQWADANRIVSTYSAEPGQWRTSRTPYLREIMDCFSDPTVNEVVFKKCARIGGTEAGLNIVGYFIDQDPSPILIVQPTVDDAKDFSKEQLAPTLADTPCLAGKVRDPRAKDGGNTIQSKLFPGGALFLVGANSPRGFRRRTARVLDLEEVDGYPASAGTEGDQIKLAKRRTATFAYRRKIYINSTPTIKGASRIEAEFDKTDQRHYHLACPDCGHQQRLVWGNLKWEEDKPDTAVYACAGCGSMIPEEAKFAMMAAGQWVPTYPGRPIRGYAINALYSPWVSWAELAAEWIDAQGSKEKLQVFINTALGETWEDKGESYDPSAVQRVTLPTDAEGYPIVPLECGLLTAAVDVQDSPARLEVLVTAWAPGEQACHLGNWRLTGDPVKAEVWETLERLRTRRWAHAGGGHLFIRQTAVDSGDNTASVCQYVRPLERRGVMATKGSSTHGAQLLTRPKKRSDRYKTLVWMVGTVAAKDLIFGRLKHVEAPGPGYQMFGDQIDPTFLKQYGAEKVVWKPMGGRLVKTYARIGDQPNEAIDLTCLSLVALYALGEPVRRALGQIAAEVVKQGEGVKAEPAPPPEAREAEEPPPPPRPTYIPRSPGRNWVTQR